MKNNFIITIFLLIFSITLNAQSSFDNGFKNGFKNGYCYSNSQNNVFCNPPITPIPPLPQINESSDSYQDGYNRGFIYGQSRRNTDDNKSSNNNGGSYQQNLGGTQETLDYSVLYKGLLANQAQRNNQQSSTNSSQNEQKNTDETIKLISQINYIFNNHKNLPDNVTSGWHYAIGTNNYDFMEFCKVYVLNNQIVKYVVDDWQERSIQSPSSINKAKAVVQLIEDDGSTGQLATIFLYAYVVDNKSSTTPPIGTGKISFWTSWKNCANMKLYFDGKYAGKFSIYFPSGIPLCEQNGTITVKYKPGTYKFQAVSGWKNWEGTVTIQKDGCQTFELKK